MEWLLIVMAAFALAASVAGDEIKLTAEIPNAGQTVEYTVKRVS